MLRWHVLSGFVCVFLSVSAMICRAADKGHSSIDWPTFMARHDLTWTQPLDAEPGDAPFLGNGKLGLMVRQADASTLTCLIGNANIEDRRDIYYGRCRLPIGDFLLHTVGTITATNLRLSLWEAELSGTVTTSAGVITVRAIVHAVDPLILVELVPSAGEAECRWEFKPADAVNPRWRGRIGSPVGSVYDLDLSKVKLRDEKLRGELTAYPLNPKPQSKEIDGVHTLIQTLAKGQFVTAWRETAAGNTRRLYVSNAYQWDEPHADACLSTVNAIKQGVQQDVDALLAAHRSWWHDYYPKSFLSISDPYWESFYWIQLYKFASATRGGSDILDQNGPWLLPTPWPGTWWNLNEQLLYWIPLVSNHVELADPLRRGLLQHQQNLIDSVPEQYRADSAALGGNTTHDLVYWLDANGPRLVEPPDTIGNLIWALHDVWLQYRMTMDERIFSHDIVPLLRRAVNYDLHFLKSSDDGRLHLPVTWSPEYPKRGPDTNYELSLLRWGLQTLMIADDRFALHDPLRPTWESALKNLAAYPQNTDGYLIADGVPYAVSHRHFSHLLMVYPLYLVNVENGGRDIIERSIAHWQSMPKALLGYSFTGSASMYAELGNGDQALKQLNGLKSFIKPNTMYFEAGPVMETPFAGCQSISDMLLQSWQGPQGSVIRVFPAVPSEWPDAAFEDWRAEGAFLVSASRTGGKTNWVRVESLAGGLCRVRPKLDGKVRIADATAAARLTDLGDGVYQIDLAKDQSVTFVGDTTPASFHAVPVNTVGLPAHFGGPAIQAKPQ